MFPEKINLLAPIEIKNHPYFIEAWTQTVNDSCFNHKVWDSDFILSLKNTNLDQTFVFQLAAVWSTNMVHGSYCFPRYSVALAARAEEDSVRYGLIENAWDEAGAYSHHSRSHFWLAVKLARLLQLSDNEIEAIIPLVKGKKYTDEHYRVCSEENFGFGLGTICLIEEFTTPEFSTILNAFLWTVEKGLGISTSEFILNGGAEYFTANISDDERHREEMPKVVATYLLSSGVDLSNRDQIADALIPIKNGMLFSADLRKEFYEDIYNFVVKGGTFRNLLN